MRSHVSTSFHPERRNLTLTDHVHPAPLTISHSIVPTSVAGSSAIYWLKVQKEQVTSDRSVRSHLVTPTLKSKTAVCILLSSLRLTDFSRRCLKTHKVDGPTLKQPYSLRILCNFFSLVTIRSYILTSKLAPVYVTHPQSLKIFLRSFTKALRTLQ